MSSSDPIRCTETRQRGEVVSENTGRDNGLSVLSDMLTGINEETLGVWSPPLAPRFRRIALARWARYARDGWALAFAASCASPTEPQARGCTLTQPLAMPAGWTAALSQHFDACPAAPGAQSLGAYVVRWD